MIRTQESLVLYKSLNTLWVSPCHKNKQINHFILLSLALSSPPFPYQVMTKPLSVTKREERLRDRGMRVGLYVCVCWIRGSVGWRWHGARDSKKCVFLYWLLFHDQYCLWLLFFALMPWKFLSWSRRDHGGWRGSGGAGAPILFNPLCFHPQKTILVWMWESLEAELFWHSVL